MKDDVVDVDALEKIVAEEKTKGNYFLNDQKIFWAMYYTISIFHNPTGMTLPPGNLNRYLTQNLLFTQSVEEFVTLFANKRFRLYFSFSFNRKALFILKIKL